MVSQILFYARADTPVGQNITVTTFLNALYHYGHVVVNELLLGRFVRDSNTTADDGCSSGSRDV